MAVYPRSRPTTDSEDPQELLRALMEAAPAPSATLPQPIALRSAEAHRDYALRGFLRRTWVDGVLKHAEWALLVAAVVIFGAWFADGPVRDWLHERTKAPVVVAAAQPTHVARSATVVPTGVAERSAAALPFVAANAATAPDDAIIEPRRNVAAPVEVALQPTRLLIPALELDTPVKEVFVVDGVWEVAEYAAGFMHGTALPEAGGNTALAGHAGIRGAVFRDLGNLKPGDDIYLDAGGWRYHYQMRDARNVWPTQVEVLDQTSTSILTLMTCTNWDTQRLVVVADLRDLTPTPGT